MDLVTKTKKKATPRMLIHVTKNMLEAKSMMFHKSDKYSFRPDEYSEYTSVQMLPLRKNRYYYGRLLRWIDVAVDLLDWVSSDSIKYISMSGISTGLCFEVVHECIGMIYLPQTYIMMNSSTGPGIEPLSFSFHSSIISTSQSGPNHSIKTYSIRCEAKAKSAVRIYAEDWI